MSAEEAAQAIPWAVEAGYRHIDTAAMYRNQGGDGRGIKQCSKGRDKLWITTKDLEGLHAEGICKSIGVSNFMPEHLKQRRFGPDPRNFSF